jgi:small subunit ribosomal protein S4
MARYTGPKVRISRRFNEPILGDNKALQKKSYAPGQHGRGKKRKQSEYALQLSMACWKGSSPEFFPKQLV